MLNDTHDPARRSWVESANEEAADFPIQNLPFGVFSAPGRTPGGGVAIGDQILDLKALAASGLLSGPAQRAAELACGPTLNLLVEAGKATLSDLRARLSDFLSDGPAGNAARRHASRLLVPMAGAEAMLPVRIPAFTDFCASLPHIRRSERLTGAPPSDVWVHIPVAYNGRASSVRVSGTEVVRPSGVFELPPGSGLRDQPETMLDFELEVGAYLCGENVLGQRLSVSEAAERLWGLTLLNDWSGRAMQFFESALGPYLGKSFLSTVSPWIVTEEALRPFRTALHRPDAAPPVQPHLFDAGDAANGAFAIDLYADLSTATGRAQGNMGDRIVTTQLGCLSWTFAQMIAHQASNGCPLQAGDLIGCGTVSGWTDEARACLGEITEIGRQPLTLSTGEVRSFLSDGDEVVIRGVARAEGFVSIGFGECAGRVTPNCFI